MFSHLTIGTHDLARAVAFYDAVLAPLGIERVSSQYENWAAWQRPGEAAKFWVGRPFNGLPASWGNGWMAAFTAPSRAAVDAAYAAAMAGGVRLLTGATYGVATTGVAGPSEQEGKPAGTVYVAVAGPDGVQALALELSGDRERIVSRTCDEALAAYNGLFESFRADESESMAALLGWAAEQRTALRLLVGIQRHAGPIRVGVAALLIFTVFRTGRRRDRERRRPMAVRLRPGPDPGR